MKTKWRYLLYLALSELHKQKIVSTFEFYFKLLANPDPDVGTGVDFSLRCLCFCENERVPFCIWLFLSTKIAKNKSNTIWFYLN